MATLMPFFNCKPWENDKKAKISIFHFGLRSLELPLWCIVWVWQVSCFYHKVHDFSVICWTITNWSGVLKSYIRSLRPLLTQNKTWIRDCIHCYMCNGITCWLAVVGALNFNVWLRACMSNYIPLILNEIILINVLTPVLCWQISVCKRNPTWRISGSGIEPLPALLMAHFQLDHQGQTLTKFE